MKYLDMPEGNGMCSSYVTFLSQIERGRSVAIVRARNAEGSACYIYSAEPVSEITDKNTFHHCLDMVSAARLRAEANGYHPTLDVLA